ncbi:lysozyme [uncultured Kushneria sp.]|uniref:lysozyme n=1 Tax=uncultured Kushneria sp. TaxID=905033 RepID=UPI00260CFAA6|nr:lysozyme [uncultured Kushneria sp.]
MRTSHNGLDLIKAAEGLELEAYRDSVGVPTIGYGHTLNVQMGDVISRARAESLLQTDLKRFEAAVDRMVSVEINQNQFDALVSLCFNVGNAAVKSSTLLRLLNAGDYQGAADQFPRWVYAGGVKLNGLVKRRAAERDLFLAPVQAKAPSSWLDELVLCGDSNCRPYEKELS